MTALLLGLLAAGSLTTWAFLRPRGATRATAFPSLQHLTGSAAPRRRRLRLEDLPGWALRLAALACLGLGLAADRLEVGAGRLAPVVLVDPATGASGWSAALGTPASAWLGFEGETPRAAGPLGPWLEATVRACSASRQACLARAAVESGRPVVAVGARDAGWEGLDEVHQPVSWLEAALEQPPPAPPAPTPTPDPHLTLRRTGTSAAARVWAAALETQGDAPGSPAQVEILDADQAATGDEVARLVVFTAPRPAQGPWPEVTARAATGVLLPEPGATAAGVEGLVLRGALQFGASASTTSVAGGTAVARLEAGPPQVAVAATAEELGRWAHEGQLPRLARAVLAALGPGPVEAAAVLHPMGPGFRDDAGVPVPLGVLDVAPGHYTRDDGRLRLEVRRAPPGPALALPPTAAAPTSALSLTAALLGLAMLALLVAVARARRPASWLVGLAALALLGLAAADVERTVAQVPRQVLRLDPRAAPAATAPGLEVVLDGATLPCERPREPAPCRVVAALGPAASPPGWARGLVFDPTRPRLELLSVQAPGALSLGAAARLDVAVRVRRGAGQTLRVTARPTHGAIVEARLRVEGDDAVEGAALRVVPLVAGSERIVVEARLGEASDARLVSLTAQAKEAQRVVLAGAPSWEARFVAQALRDRAGGRTSSLTRIGALGVQAVGLTRAEPLRWLATADALTSVDTLVLTGFGARELAGAPAAALRGFLERGGGVLFLGAEGAVALGWPSMATPDGPSTTLEGDLLDGTPPLSLAAPAPAASATPPGAEVLATLGPEHRPWMVGRGVGQGRLAVVQGTELFRLSPPAGDGLAASRALLRALAWVEAAPAARGAAVEAASLALSAEDTAVQRAVLRADAERRGQPFLELDGPAEVTQAFGRLPELTARPLPVPVRRDPWFTSLVLGLLALEAVSRRWGSPRQGGRAP